MLSVSERSLSGGTAKYTTLVFFGLLFLSTAFFVFADDTTSTKNIFQDSDQDGLSNDEERLYGTDPYKKDSDGDGYGDGVEIESGYDPLKHAPGDKIIDERTTTAAEFYSDADNLTQKVSDEIANILKGANEAGKSISLEEVNGAVQKILSGDTETVVLPDVDVKDIKIKKLPKNIKEKNREEQEREDAVEYLTVLAYLTANNMPQSFQTGDDLSSLLTTLSTDSVTALSSGNMEYVNELADRGSKMLEELKDIEVPEKMLDTHIKALKMAKYAMQLKEELKPSQDDPLGQIEVLSKAQGFIGSTMGFVDEVYQKLSDYGIKEIPLNL